MLGELDMNFLKELINYLNTNYDNIISTIYCYNVTAIFKFIYTIIKSSLQKCTRKKIKFLKNSQLNNLKEAISIDSIEENNFEF